MRGWFLLSLLLSSCASGQHGVRRPYIALQPVSGVVRVCGSPQMAPLLELYERGFRAKQNGVTFQNDLQSTLTAVSTVSAGRADIGMLGREIWAEESDAFEKQNGHSPLLIPIATGAFDVPKATFALMIFVSKTNPIASLTLPQLRRIFSNTTKPAHVWGDVGLRGSWAHHPIHLYGFTVNNDKSRIFSDLVFAPGQHWAAALHGYSNDGGGPDAGEQITSAVAADPDGIGISNIHYANAGVKVLPLAEHAGLASVFPTPQSVAAHTYPLFRSVYAVVDRAPGKPFSPAVREFLQFLLSSDGARAVESEGNYLPLSPREAKAAAKMMQSKRQPFFALVR